MCLPALHLAVEQYSIHGGTRQKKTQKAIVIEALTSYLSQRQESLALLLAAEKTFGEWDNENDQVYETL